MTFRSFLDRVFNQGEKNQPSSIADEWIEKRKANRVDVDWPDRLEVNLLLPEGEGTGITIIGTVTNVSLKGLVIEFKEAPDKLKAPIGKDLVATLNVDDFSIPLKVKVVRELSQNRTALAFSPPYPKELSRLQQFLEPRCLGMSLREIKADSLKQEEGEKFRWFQGVNDTNLFSWANTGTGEILHHQLVFLGRVVEVTKEGLVKTGRIKDENFGVDGTVGWVKSELLQFDTVVDIDLLEKTKALIRISKIDEKIKEELISKISK